jgi:hypothetical protein
MLQCTSTRNNSKEKKFSNLKRKSCLRKQGVPMAEIKLGMWKTRRCTEGNKWSGSLDLKRLCKI